MTLTALPVLLYVIPAVMLIAALVPPRRKGAVLGLGGMLYAYAAGGIAGMILTLLSVCGAWLSLRLTIRGASDQNTKLRCAVGIGWQAAVLIAAKFLLPFPAALMPVLLCAMLGIECILSRAAHAMAVPPLAQYLCAACAMPRMFAGPVLSYPAMRKAMRTRKVTAEGVGAGAHACILGLSELVLLSLPMYTLLHELDSYAAPLTAADAWLTLLVFSCAVYHGLRGALRFGRGLAVMLGLHGAEETPVYPVGAETVCDFWQRSLPSSAAWAKRVLLPDVRETDIGRYFVRLFLFFGGIGMLFGSFWCGLLFGVLQAGLLTLRKLPAVSKRLTPLPKFVRQSATAVLMLMGLGLMQCGSLTELFTLGGAMFGVNGGALSGTARYLCGTHLLPLLLSILLLFPVIPAVKRRIEKLPQARKAAVFVIPAAELVLLLCCMAELMNIYLRG